MTFESTLLDQRFPVEHELDENITPSTNSNYWQHAIMLNISSTAIGLPTTGNTPNVYTMDQTFMPNTSTAIGLVGGTCIYGKYV